MRRVLQLLALGVALCGLYGCESANSRPFSGEVDPAQVQREDAAVAEAEKAEAARQAESAALPPGQP